MDESSGALRIAGTRVSLTSVVISFRDGECPERIVEAFPTLSLAPVNGAIAYHRDNQELIDAHIADVEREFERVTPPLSQSNPDLFARLRIRSRKWA